MVLGSNPRPRRQKNGSSKKLPLLHSGLDLHRLVSAEDDADVDLAGVGLLLAKEVVDSSLDVRTESRDRKSFGGVAVLGPLRVPELVAVVAHEPENPGGITI